MHRDRFMHYFVYGLLATTRQDRRKHVDKRILYYEQSYFEWVKPTLVWKQLKNEWASEFLNLKQA